MSKGARVMQNDQHQHDTEEKEKEPPDPPPPSLSVLRKFSIQRSAFGEGTSPGSAQTMRIAEGLIALEVAKLKCNE